MTSKQRDSRDASAANYPLSALPPEGLPTAAAPAERRGGLVVVMPERSQTRVTLSGPQGRMVDRQTQAAIGQQLRSLYNEIATSPVPDRLLKLLQQLDEKGSGS